MSWFASLREDFGDDAPDPARTGSIVAAVQEQAGARLRRYLGSCTNGIAFLTDKRTVLKFTVDQQEAVLWGQLWGWEHPNLAKSLGSWQLVSRLTGPLIVYVVAVEYVPTPVGADLARALTAATQGVYATGGTRRPTSKRELTLQHLRALRPFAGDDPRVDGIIDLVVSLADMGVHIYDLQPDNFRLADDGAVKLIDPSTPTGARGTPKPIVFESRHGLGVGHILF